MPEFGLGEQLMDLTTQIYTYALSQFQMIGTPPLVMVTVMDAVTNKFREMAIVDYTNRMAEEERKKMMEAQEQTEASVPETAE